MIRILLICILHVKGGIFFIGANLMYSPLESIFEATMEREGETLVTYSDGVPFKAFFRMRNDNESQRETIVIYYGISAPVYSGTLVIIGGKTFLAINKETVENDVYYKSTLMKCNGIYNDNGGEICNIPFYSDNMKSPLMVGNNVVDNLNGNIELLTEENLASKQIKIDQCFNEFGRTFKVANIYTIDGIMHIIAEVYFDMMPQIQYSIQINGVSDMYMKPNDTRQLSATLYRNGAVVAGAAFDWKSSDHTVAKVDHTGKVTSVSEGIVKITVTWMEKMKSESVYLVVANGDGGLSDTYHYRVDGNASLRNSYRRTYSLCVTDQNGAVVNSVVFQWNVVSDFEVIQNQKGNKIELCVNGEEWIGRRFFLQAIIDGNIKAELPIKIVE